MYEVEPKLESGIAGEFEHRRARFAPFPLSLGRWRCFLATSERQDERFLHPHPRPDTRSCVTGERSNLGEAARANVSENWRVKVRSAAEAADTGSIVCWKSVSAQRSDQVRYVPKLVFINRIWLSSLRGHRAKKISDFAPCGLAPISNDVRRLAAPSSPYRLSTYWQEAVCRQGRCRSCFSRVGAAVCATGNRPAFLRDEHFS
jgi:hypothetical protein